MSTPSDTEKNTELPDSIYYPFKRLPGVKLAAYAFACTGAALEHAEEGILTAYCAVVRSWNLPGCQKLIGEMALFEEDTSTWLRSLDGALSGDNPLADWPAQWATVFVNTEGNADVHRLFELASYFVLSAFNRSRDLENRTPKVLPFVQGKDPYLLFAVVIFAFQDYLALEPEVKGPMAWSEGSLTEFARFCDDMLASSSNTKREERVLNQAIRQTLRQEGYALIHDSKMLKAAEAWYKCRVNPGSIEAYRDELAKENKYLERSNIETAIAPYDQVTGYPRKWRR